ncbi:hypothetical protein [Saliphagus sp. LR7]|uniref:hypothetical protein n=1 Tax=Saliphagus sp. LR7 TaxID=2282654 RepID=UPI000DF820A0|nr:hypothetical protein [Saliphagus sp. LR7]
MPEPELPMLPDGTTLRWPYLERGPYADVVVFATVEDGRIQFQGEPRSPSGATREFDQLIRGEEGYAWDYPWEEWEWHTGTEWVPISRLKGE